MGILDREIEVSRTAIRSASRRSKDPTSTSTNEERGSIECAPRELEVSMRDASAENILQIVEKANQCAADEWKLWLYSREADKLVIWSSLIRGGRHAYLVFRSPRYLRFEAAVSTPVFTGGERAREVMKLPPPPTIWADSSNLILASSGASEFVVLCESAAFYQVKWQDSWLGSPRKEVTLRRERTDVAGRSNRIVDKIEHCQEVQGTTLHWNGLHVSHTALVLTTEEPVNGPLALRFHLTEYVECPMKMTRVRLRMATAEENAALRTRVSSRLASWYDPPLSSTECGMTPAEAHLVIECDEGVYSIWAGAFFLSWYDRWEGLLDLPALDPLWRGGPPLAEL
jgi:hypothetical protein